MSRSILTKLNRSVIAVILAFLLLATFAGDQTAAQGLADPRFDLTNNGVIDNADAAVILNAVALLQEEGLCISPELANRDINGDGCVDIFDAQIVLAHWGERTRPEPAPPPIGPAATTFTVNSSGDASDSNPGDGVCATGSGDCTLRAAIEESNNLPGPETIDFHIRNSDGSCPGTVTISLATSPIDLIIDAPDDAGVTIDGYSQGCGASPNTHPVTGNAVIRIQIKGVRSSSYNGLSIYSNKNTVKGLALYRSTYNLYIDSGKNNTIQGNIVGSTADLSYGSYGYGVAIRHSGSYNLIGGIAPQERNIMSGNSNDAVALRGPDVRLNVIIGNYVGVKQDGKTKGRNTADGFDISHGARYNWIGASPPGWIASSATSSSAKNWPPSSATWPPNGWQVGDPVPAPDPNRNYDSGERNVVSGNGRDGIEVSHVSTTAYNYVVNNYVGISASGTQAAGNGSNGITLEDTPNHHFFYNNVVGNNGYSGFRAYALNNYHQIVNNYIGVAPDGVTPMPNGTSPPDYQRFGIYLFGGAHHNLIKNNIIANHPKHGIEVSGAPDYLGYSNETYYNTISQNSIYNNGLEAGGRGINLKADGVWVGNQGLAAPQITLASQAVVNGTACPACTIEIFIAQINDSFDFGGGEGKTYLATGTADGSGNFSIPIPFGSVNVGEKVTATATDTSGNTSEFGPNVDVSDGQTPIGYVLLNGGTGLQSAYGDVLAQFFAVDNVAVTGWRYRVDNSNFSGVSWTTVSPGESPLEREEPLSLSGGLHTVYAQYKDGDGNVSVVYNATITIVNVGNPGNLPNGAITINNGAPYTNDPNLSLQLIGPPPPFYTQDMKIGESPTLNGSGWEPYTVQSSSILNNPPSTSQLVNMYAQFRDVDGTTVTSIVSDDILFDPISPTLTISFDLGAKELDLSGTHDDNNGSGLGEMRFYDQGLPSHDTGWISYQTTYTWPWSGGAEIIVEVRDNAGNVSIASSPEIIPGPRIESIYLPFITRGSK